MNETAAGSEDLTELLGRLRETAKGFQARLLSAAGPDELAEYKGRLEKKGKGKSPVILASDTAVELGSPRLRSAYAALWTRDKSLVTDGAVTVIGPGLAESEGKALDYAQLTALALGPEAEPNPFKLESIQFLARRLPGVMSRTVPGRLWVRVSHQAIEAGVDFRIIGGALRETYKKEMAGVEAVESFFVTLCGRAVDQFSAIASEARIHAGSHKKLALGVDGSYECKELECDSCDEKPVCDRIREVAIIRKRKKKESAR